MNKKLKEMCKNIENCEQDSEFKCYKNIPCNDVIGLFLEHKRYKL